MLVCVLLGPVSALAAGTDACGVACPCEEDGHAAHAEDHGDEPSGHESDDPVDEQCPEDCPGCHAGPGVALTSFESASPRSPPTALPSALAPRDVGAAGVCTGVFRPPRS